jgi:xylulokinase
MWLGLDIGTSAVKAAIVDDASAVVAQASAPLSVSRPRPLWSEQSPDAWWTAAQAAIGGLPAAARGAVRGLGLAGQMHGAVLLGADDRPLRPAILWNDGRSVGECAALEDAEPLSRAITGNIAMPGFTAPKLLWVRRHEPDIFAATRRVLLPKDYVRLRLTGGHASDLSDSAGTLWLDVARRDWSDAMLAATGLSRSHMPALFEGNAITGALLPDVAAALGLPVVPVAAGGGDNAAGAVGIGVIDPGDGFLSLGTSGVIFTVSEGLAANPAQAVHAFCHALPGRWHQMAVILSAASALDWAARLAGFASVAAALAAAEANGDAGVPVFLPYLSGERTPHNDPHAKGVLFGMTHDTDGGALVRGVLEGVAFAFADGARALREAGTPIGPLSVIGGGARSRLWGSILAAAIGCRLDYRADAEVGPALGAARLARLAVTGEPASTCGQPLLLGTVEPEGRMYEQLAPRHALFRGLYPALKDSFREGRHGVLN